MASVEKRLRDGGVTYLARWRDETGQQRSKTFFKKGEADRWAAGMVTALARGQYVDPRAGRVPVAEYAERWRRVQDHRDTTAVLYERVLRLHVYPVLGARPLSSVRHTDARAFVTGLNRTMAPNTARQVHAITRTIFAAAVSDRLIAESPFLNIRLPAVQRDKVQPLAVDDVRRIADAAPARLRALVLLAAGTGLRSGELLGLTVDRLDFLPREVRVDRQLVYLAGRPPYLAEPKTRESVRTVPVPTFALDAVAAHLAAYAAGRGRLDLPGGQGRTHPADDAAREVAADAAPGGARRRAALPPPAAPLRLGADRRRGERQGGAGAAGARLARGDAADVRAPHARKRAADP